jgi:hypothetical protein
MTKKKPNRPQLRGSADGGKGRKTSAYTAHEPGTRPLADAANAQLKRQYLQRSKEQELIYDLGEGWHVVYSVAAEGGVPVIRRLTVQPKDDAQPPPGGITRRRLRDVPLTPLLSQWKAAWDLVLDTLDPDTAKVFRHAYGFRIAKGATVPKPGRRGHPDSFYAEIAQLYVSLVREGSPRPIEQIAEKANRSVAGVRDLVHSARAKGLLTASPPGKPGGELTDKALRLLGREES